MTHPDDIEAVAKAIFALAVKDRPDDDVLRINAEAVAKRQRDLVRRIRDIEARVHGTEDRDEFTRVIRAAITAYEASKREREEEKNDDPR